MLKVCVRVSVGGGCARARACTAHPRGEKQNALRFAVRGPRRHSDVIIISFRTDISIFLASVKTKKKLITGCVSSVCIAGRKRAASSGRVKTRDYCSLGDSGGTITDWFVAALFIVARTTAKTRSIFNYYLLRCRARVWRSDELGAVRSAGGGDRKKFSTKNTFY